MKLKPYKPHLRVRDGAWEVVVKADRGPWNAYVGPEGSFAEAAKSAQNGWWNDACR
jgi:hypothetical protein